MRKLELSWKDLEKLLQETGEVINKGEEIREITLMKPRKLRIYLVTATHSGFLPVPDSEIETQIKAQV